MKLARLSRRASLGIVLGLVLAGSVAFAATLAVTSAGITTHSGPAALPPTTCTLTSTADAALGADFPDFAAGTLNGMTVRHQNGNNARRSIARFDIASCAIPSNAVVRTSVLRLTVTSGPGSNRTYGAHRVTAGWNEGTVTWNSQNSQFAAGATASVATGAAPASLSWSVLPDVSAFVSGSATNNGWLIKDAIETGNPSEETVFATRENATPANHPSLTITYYR